MGNRKESNVSGLRHEEIMGQYGGYSQVSYNWEEVLEMFCNSIKMSGNGNSTNLY